MGTAEIYESTTEAIIEAIEEGAGTWSMPWTAAGLAFPTNPATGNRYHGGNVVSLWVAALQAEYTSGDWATYKAWQSIGAQVRKGEHGTAILFFARMEEDDEPGDEAEPARCIARRYVVFNACQVDGYATHTEQRDNFEHIEEAEQFFQATGASIEHRSEGRAYYRPSEDLIVLPPTEAFDDAPAYYGTLAHEAAHWTGHPSRLARTFGDRFGDDAYAVKELTAELSAAFTCALLGISPTPRPDHAAYLAGWLRVLKSDSRALHAIAAKAQKATDYLFQLRRESVSYKYPAT